MFRNKYVRLVLVPLLVGLVTTGIVYYYLEQAQPEESEPVPMGEVVVARQAIPAGTVLNGEMLTLQVLPKEYLPPYAITEIQQAQGKVTTVPLAAGEPVLETKVAAPGYGKVLAYRIPPGKRAVTLRVNEVTGVAGFLRPGDRVDVLATLPREVAGEEKTVLVAGNLEILAVAQSTEGKEEPVPLEALTSVTLAATPEQAAVLTLAEERGSLRMLLRPVVEEERHGSVEVTGEFFQHPEELPVFEPETQVRIRILLAEVEREDFPELGLKFSSAPTFTELTREVLAKLDVLVANDRAMVVRESELITMNHRQASYTAGSKLPVYVSAGGVRLLNWEWYGIKLSVLPVAYNRPFFDLTINSQVRVVTVEGEPPVHESGLRFVDMREASGTVRIDRSELVVVSGFLRPEDFKTDRGPENRYVLPPDLLSPDLKAGQRGLLVFVIPDIDWR